LDGNHQTMHHPFPFRQMRFRVIGQMLGIQIWPNLLSHRFRCALTGFKKFFDRFGELQNYGFDFAE